MATEAGAGAPATVMYSGRREFKAGDTATMALDVRVADKAWPAGSRLWLCVDIRQGCGSLQAEDPAGSGYVSAAVVSTGARLAGRQPGPAGLPCRSMDWLPEMPEFVQLVEFETAGELAPGETIRIEIGGSAGFALPGNSIDAFHLWVLADDGEGVTVQPDLGQGLLPGQLRCRPGLLAGPAGRIRPAATTAADLAEHSDLRRTARAHAAGGPDGGAAEPTLRAAG